ncbi:MAG: hypothetical protein KIT11_11150 [Fimbriimonadaceae bacterium]|nr:hypothetical protein [Fimbriimonadaceae bacterium]QYK55409.1 MAG: hypothetical protein KF733_10385 [Fimbriimonadaceae bacterium]
MKFLVAIHRPNDFDHGTQITKEVVDAIDQVNQDMIDAGVRVFVGGLKAPGSAKTIRRAVDGSLSVTDGRHLEAQEYVDGFWVLDVASPDEALEWGKKAAAACRGSVEVRPFA